MQDTQIIILAAGNGTRMKHSLPKVLVPVKGRPMIEILLERILASGLTKKPVVIVSKKNKKLIKERLGKRCSYVIQEKQLGTGNAVLSARKLLEGKYKNILVLNGDHPFLETKTLIELVSFTKNSANVLTMATTKVSSFTGWQKTFFDFGRIVRSKKGSILRIVEKKDSSAKELKIKEVNAGYYCFDAKWLWKNLTKIKNKNSQAEYYLPDAVKLAIKSKQKVSSYIITPQEALGINDRQQLSFAEQFLGRQIHQSSNLSETKSIS